MELNKESLNWTWIKDAIGRIASELTLTQRLVLSGALVGVCAGASTYLFDRLIVLATRLSIANVEPLSWLWRAPLLLILPALGALLGALLIHYVSPEAKGHGVNEVYRAITQADGHIPGTVAWVKSVASALTIGLGGSAGREGPSIQIGAAAGSWVGQKLGVPYRDMRTLAAAGAAAGLGAVFGTPLAAVFFTMEVVLKNFASEAFPAVVIAAVTAVASARFLLGSESFLVPLNYDWHGLGDFLAYCLLGFTVAPFGTLYMKLLARLEQKIENQNRFPVWFTPAFGGIAVGVIALAFPQILGTGRATINGALKGQLHGWTAGALVLAKIAATCATLGTGGSGGAFMPSVFIGSMAGSAWASLFHSLFNLPVQQGAFALVGMACAVTAAYQAPVTAMIMALEISHDYDILMPVMFACVIAYLTTRRRPETPMIEH